MSSEARTVGKHQAAREAVDILLEVATLLVYTPFPSCITTTTTTSPAGIELTVTRAQNTQLDRTSLSLCVHLIENGVNPEALAVSSPAFGHRQRPRNEGDG